jgi:hypothetical protein
MREAESRLEIEKLVQLGLDRVEIQAFEFPEGSREPNPGGREAEGVRREGEG